MRVLRRGKGISIRVLRRGNDCPS